MYFLHVNPCFRATTISKEIILIDDEKELCFGLEGAAAVVWEKLFSFKTMSLKNLYEELEQDWDMMSDEGKVVHAIDLLKEIGAVSYDDQKKK